MLDAGYHVVVIDNLSNSSRQSIDRIEQITAKEVDFYPIDLRNQTAVTAVFKQHTIAAVIHLAGWKAVGESCQLPLKYYQNNLVATMVLLEVMQQFSVTKLVFSSSATVYGDTKVVPVTEQFPLTATNPYGRTKLMIEEILRDITATSSLHVMLLRYFNPVGAHKSGLIGENPNGIPNNLLPYVAQVAIGERDKVSVFGGDYPTKDGTGVRDYIHVVDLAKAHVKALQAQVGESTDETGSCKAYNLGTGQGFSVLEVISAFEKACGHKIPYQIVARRPGDIAESYADPSLANDELGWQAQKGLDEMMRDAWRWQSTNPKGYSHD